MPDQDTTLHFGRSQSVRAFDIDYKLSLQGVATNDGREVQTLRQRFGEKKSLQLDILQFHRSDGVALNTELIMARARVIGDRVKVTICIDRRHAGALGGPGEYQGTVSIIDPRVSRVDLPLNLEASYPDWPRALSLVAIALLAGSWVTWVVKEQKTDGGQFEARSWAGWSTSAIGLISTVAGAVAVVAVFTTRYLNNPTWGASATEFVALITGAFVAFMGATTSLHVAGLADRFRRTQVADAAGQDMSQASGEDVRKVPEREASPAAPHPAQGGRA